MGISVGAALALELWPLNMNRRLVFVTSLVLSLTSCALTAKGLTAMHDLIANQLLNVPATDFFDDRNDAQLADAAGHGNLDRAQQLLAQGANANAAGRRAMTPLLWTMGKRNIEGFRFLLDHGADANSVTCCDDKALGMVHKLSAMGLAARIENSTYLEELLDHKGDPNLIIDELNDTPIFSTLLDRRDENARLLVQHGANLNLQTAMSRMTPLLEAVYQTNYEMALLLLRANADPTIKNKWNISVVDHVKKNGNRGVQVLRIPRDVTAYDEFVEELKRSGLLDADPPHFP